MQPLLMLGLPHEGCYTKTFVERVELAYYAAPIIDIPYPGGVLRDPFMYIVQPVWRFVGRTEDGTTFEVLVQAVRDEYLK